MSTNLKLLIEKLESMTHKTVVLKESRSLEIDAQIEAIVASMNTYRGNKEMWAKKKLNSLHREVEALKKEKEGLPFIEAKSIVKRTLKKFDIPRSTSHTTAVRGYSPMSSGYEFDAFYPNKLTLRIRKEQIDAFKNDLRNQGLEIYDETNDNGKTFNFKMIQTNI